MAAPTMPGMSGNAPEQKPLSQTTQQINPDYTPEEIQAAREHVRRVKRNTKIAAGLLVASVVVGGAAYLGLRGEAKEVQTTVTVAEPQHFTTANQIPLSGDRQKAAEAIVENHFALLSDFANTTNSDPVSHVENRLPQQIGNELELLYTPAYLKLPGSEPSVPNDTVGQELTSLAVRFGDIEAEKDKGFSVHDLEMTGTVVGKVEFDTAADGSETFTARVHQTGEFKEPGGKPSAEKLDQDICYIFQESNFAVPNSQGYYENAWRIAGSGPKC